MNPLLLVELVLFALVALAGWVGAGWAVEGAIASAGFRDLTGDAAAVQAAGRAAAGWFVGGVGVVALARVATSFRKGRHVHVPVLLPACFGAAGLGLAVQLGYGNPFSANWPGPAFGVGVFVAGCVGAAILAVPGDVAAWISRGRHALGLGAVGVFVALALFGDAPGASDAKVNLGPVQPIEAAKVAVALWLADSLGRRAGKLRYQRARAAFLRFPRPTLLLPALLALLLSFAGLFLVRDFGPTLILGLVF
ncbi:MAG: hypothetical protein ACOZNI_27670, partial [Myxococcota bacterium]